ncbi:MAG: hypothetical protein R3195_17530 [Gemmatimonadota bacterium]|nr:hypothetical protein [Gemmatimonadota bacterium]
MRSLIKTLSSSRSSLILVVLLAFVAACSDSDPTGPPGPNDDEFVELLYGSWDWTYAMGGIAGETITPASEGYTRQVVLSEPNLIELYRDGALEVSTTFEFLPAEDLGDISQPATLRYADPILGFDEQEVGFSIEGELILIDPCCDGYLWAWAATE